MYSGRAAFVRPPRSRIATTAVFLGTPWTRCFHVFILLKTAEINFIYFDNALEAS